MSHIYVAIELDDLGTNDLIDELEKRSLDDHEQQLLLSLIKSDHWKPDAKKWELFLQIKDKYSFIELEELLKEKFTAQPIPKEQLSLSLPTTRN